MPLDSIFNLLIDLAKKTGEYEILRGSILPLNKKIALVRALNQLPSHPLNIELSEDGSITIETHENGEECFYAICTEQGDFKGIWQSNGILKRHSWTAIPPYNPSITFLLTSDPATSTEAQVP